jgi:hypothetical protein
MRDMWENESFFFFLKRDNDRVLIYEWVVHNIYQEYLKFERVFEIWNWKFAPIDGRSDIRTEFLVQKKTSLFPVSTKICFI